jgi:hypothetical protein
MSQSCSDCSPASIDNAEADPPGDGPAHSNSASRRHALPWLGTLYRNPAEAIKEHVSNAIDEHLKATAAGAALDRCDVVFTLDRRQITIDYPYGMSRAEFETALQRVASSAKRAGSARTIGRLGIGIFSFQQSGRRCTFLSRKSAAGETLRVVLKEGADEASIETALARERLDRPGLRVIVSELKFDPLRSRGPLAPDSLRRYLAEKFEAYLRQGWLRITIRAGVVALPVTPARIDLPPLLAELRDIPLPGDSGRRVRLELYFDPSGRGRVAIRHQGPSADVQRRRPPDRPVRRRRRLASGGRSRRSIQERCRRRAAVASAMKRCRSSPGRASTADS